MSNSVSKHPAPFSAPVLDYVRSVVADEQSRLNRPIWVLDPMAGVGRIHELRDDCGFIRTVGVEIEEEWANAHADTIHGDATELGEVLRSHLGREQKFDVTCTSPCYGNRLADHHDAKDASRRITYKHYLGHDLAPNSGASLQWGKDYQVLHQAILYEMIAATTPGGLVIVNVSNHVRRHEVQPVVEWYVSEMLRAGLSMVLVKNVRTSRMRFGANWDVRVEYEHVIAMRKPL